MREKKSNQTAYLRLRCNELAELERENKKAKTKMLGGGQSPAASSVKDTTSVAGSTAAKRHDPMSGLELKKKSEDTSPSKGKERAAKKQEMKIVEVPEEEKNLMITLDNYIEI